jgi:hypothetical protein
MKEGGLRDEWRVEKEQVNGLKVIHNNFRTDHSGKKNGSEIE